MLRFIINSLVPQKANAKFNNNFQLYWCDRYNQDHYYRKYTKMSLGMSTASICPRRHIKCLGATDWDYRIISPLNNSNCPWVPLVVMNYSYRRHECISTYIEIQESPGFIIVTIQTTKLNFSMFNSLAPKIYASNFKNTIGANHNNCR